MNKNISVLIGGVIVIGIIIALDVIFNGVLTAGKGMPMTINTISEATPLYKIQAEYPQFSSIDPAFSQKLDSFMKDQVATFKKDSQNNWDARKATATPEFPVPENPEQPFDFIASWTPAQINNKYISFVINIYAFSGGANGREGIYSFNYDVVKKQVIDTKTFLNSSETVLQKISDLASQYVTSQLSTSGMQMDEVVTQMIKDGTAPTYDNFKTFTFNSNSVTFYFQKYQVAPGADGSFNFVLFSQILKSNGINIGYLN